MSPDKIFAALVANQALPLHAHLPSVKTIKSIIEYGQPKKSIVHILWDFGPSGAHIFAVNLANEQAKDYHVTLINMNPRSVNPILKERIDPKVNVVNLYSNRLIRGAAYHIGDFLTGMKQNNPLFAALLARALARL